MNEQQMINDTDDEIEDYHDPIQKIIDETPDVPDSYQDMFVTDFASVLEKLEQEYNGSSAQNAFMAELLVKSVGEYLYNTARYQKHHRALHNAIQFNQLCQKVFGQEFANRLQRQKDLEQKGFFVVGLVLYGSSVEQAQVSIAEWTKCSKSTVKNGYEKIAARHEIVEHNDRIGFVQAKAFDLVDIISQFEKRPFPNGQGTIGKTRKAFDQLQEDLQKYFETNNIQHRLVHDPFSISPKLTKVKAG